MKIMNVSHEKVVFLVIIVKAKQYSTTYRTGVWFLYFFGHSSCWVLTFKWNRTYLFSTCVLIMTHHLVTRLYAFLPCMKLLMWIICSTVIKVFPYRYIAAKFVVDFLVVFICLHLHFHYIVFVFDLFPWNQVFSSSLYSNMQKNTF